MTEKAYPFSTGPGAYVTEDDWAAMTTGYQDNGVYGHPGTSDLTIEPGATPGTIQVNIGDAQISGYHYRLTAPKDIPTVANAGTTDRWDTVVLHLDRVSRTVTPVLLVGTNIWDIGGDRCPIGLWKQPPASAVTANYWGAAVDARWFIGNRVRPYLASAIPPAKPGALIFNPADPTAGSVYLGKLDASNQPYWAPWYPIASERIDPVEDTSGAMQSTTSTNWVAGTDQVAVTFEAPPSGKVMVTVFARLESEGSSSAFCGFEIRENNAAGAQVVAPNVHDAAGVQFEYWSGSTRRKLVTGLTPGETYFARALHRSDRAGIEVILPTRSILVEPVYTEVAPGTPPEGGIGIDPSTVVLTSGGSSIRIPDDNTSTQALNIRIPAGDRATAPDTFVVYYNTGTDEAPNWQRTGYFNEYGEFRVIPSSPNRTPLRIKGVAGQTANLFEATDLDNVAMAGIKPNGEIFAPNVGNAAVHAGAEPTAPSDGDLWVDLTVSPPVLKIRTAGGWSPITGGSVDPDPVGGAPEFMGVATEHVNFTSVSVPLPVGDTILACIAWNTTEALTAPPGWTKVQEIVNSNSRAAVYSAASTVEFTEFSVTASAKFTVVALGYEAATVSASDKLAETTSGTVHSAPALAVTTVPATLVRFYWDKASTTTTATLSDAGATQRGVRFGVGSGAPFVLGSDQLVETSGTVPAASVTTNATSAQAGGFSVALVAA